MLESAQSRTLPVSSHGQAADARLPAAGSAVQAPVSSITGIILNFAQKLELEAGWTVHIITRLSLTGLAAQAGIPAASTAMAVEQLVAARLLTLYRGRYLLCDVEALRRVVLDQQA